MLKIHISKIDELLDLCAQLGLVTYLQWLFYQDEASGASDNDDLHFAHEYAKVFLFDAQYEAVIRLRELITGDDFTISDN